MKKQNLTNQICKRCVCDTTILGIVFDGKGICNFCKIHDKMEKEYPKGRIGQQKLKELVAKIKRAGKNKRYDCVVGISGGRDSTYLVYLAKKLGLRPLAVHFDNGWNSELAVTNIKNVLDKLKVDLETLVVNWEEFKDLQKSFLKASVCDAEIPTDIGIFGTLNRVAAREGIRYILNGHSFRTEGIMPLSWTYMDGRYIESVQKQFGTKKLKSFPNFKFWDLFVCTFIKNIKTVPILNYVDYNHKKIQEIMVRKLSWRYSGGHHHESYYTNFFQSYLLPQKFKIDKRKIEASALIRSGQITRQKALFQIKKEYPYDKNLVEYVIGKLDLTRKEFDQILALPVKSFNEYPTYYSLVKLFRLPLLMGVKSGFFPELLYQKFFPERIK